MCLWQSAKEKQRASRGLDIYPQKHPDLTTHFTAHRDMDFLPTENPRQLCLYFLGRHILHWKTCAGVSGCSFFLQEEGQCSKAFCFSSYICCFWVNDMILSKAMLTIYIGHKYWMAPNQSEFRTSNKLILARENKDNFFSTWQLVAEFVFCFPYKRKQNFVSSAH